LTRHIGTIGICSLLVLMFGVAVCLVKAALRDLLDRNESLDSTLESVNDAGIVLMGQFPVALVVFGMLWCLLPGCMQDDPVTKNVDLSFDPDDEYLFSGPIDVPAKPKKHQKQPTRDIAASLLNREVRFADDADQRPTTFGHEDDYHFL